MSSESALTVVNPHMVMKTPVERGATQFEEYQALQKALDSLMPEQIISIRGKKFRRKGYWRAVAKGFRVTTEVVREERVEVDSDWGYLFIIRATNGAGESAEGDGACMASEKASGQATLHNVRAHAFTRAKNRAISDLVGFGEVSAEEIEREERDVTPPTPQRTIVSHELPPTPHAYDGLAKDGTWPIGKYRGKMLADLPEKFLEWAVETLAEKPKLRQAASNEIDRRASLSEKVSQDVDSDSVPF